MKNFEIIVVSTDDREYIHQCIEIAKENNVVKGGTLHHFDLVELSKYVVCVVDGEKVLGYAGAMENVSLPNSLHINTLAVSKELFRKGIGSAILNYIIHHSLGYDAVTSNARYYNTGSIKLHQKMGFKQEEGKNENYNYTILTKDVTENQILCYSELDKIIE